jgi:hypothetical protein
MQTPKINIQFLVSLNRKYNAADEMQSTILPVALYGPQPAGRTGIEVESKLLKGTCRPYRNEQENIERIMRSILIRTVFQYFYR